MSPYRAWMLSVGLLLVVGTSGCEETPGPVAEPESVQEPGPVAEEPEHSPTETEVGREAAVAAIEKLGGKVVYRLLSDEVIDGVVLARTKATDAHLVHLKELGSFTILQLDNTQITDAGLEHLKGMVSLGYLNLSDTQVTDSGLEHLKGLTYLKYLSLGGTQVTDAGLEHLKGLTRLQSMGLSGTQVTDEGVKKLQEALPNCQIER